MDLKDRPTLHVKCSLLNIWFAHLPFNFDETFIQVLKPSYDGKNARFCCSFSYFELCSEDSLFFSSAVVATLCQSSTTFCKTRVWLKSESLWVCISLQYISIQEQKIEPADISLMRVPRNVSYGQWNKVYNSLQYRITEWLVDIQNTGTLTGEKLKKKFCSLKLTHPPDEFVIFDTRPQDFIVVTTANMNPCLWLSDAMSLHALQTDVNLSYMQLTVPPNIPQN